MKWAIKVLEAELNFKKGALATIEHIIHKNDVDVEDLKEVTMQVEDLKRALSMLRD